MVVTYKVDGGSFKADKPQPWSQTSTLNLPGLDPFDIHPDGERFAVSAFPENTAEAKRDHVIIVSNFFDELRRLAPLTK